MSMQQERPVEIKTPLGADALLFRHMSGSEEMGRLFRYDLDLYSADHAIALADLLGQTVTIRLNLPEDEQRFFHGYVSEFQPDRDRGRLRRLPGGGAPVAVAPYPDLGLPDLPGDDRTGHRQGGLSRSRVHGLRRVAVRQLPNLGVLLAVS